MRQLLFLLLTKFVSLESRADLRHKLHGIKADASILDLIEKMQAQLQYDPTVGIHAETDPQENINSLKTELAEDEDFNGLELLGSVKLGTNKTVLTAVYTSLATLFPSASTSSGAGTSDSGAPVAESADWMKPNFSIKLGDVDFPCHDWVLCSRWAYARNALAFGGYESHTSTLELPVDAGFTPDLIEAFLRFLYTDDCSGFVNMDQASAIFDISSQFRLVDMDGQRTKVFWKLIDHCYKLLIPDLTVTSQCIKSFLKVTKYGTPMQQSHIASAMVIQMKSLTQDPKTYDEIAALGLDTVMSILKSVATQIR